MNEKFYNLPQEKQQKIINAGFKVFSQNSYKKSPMSEIADAAGISKSLLFFYFRNKKELYLFLWEKAAEITMKYLSEYRCYEPGDLFEKMERGMAAKLHIMEKYPHMSQFTVKAFYEKGENVCRDIHESYRKHFNMKAAGVLSDADPDEFIPGLDINMMYREMHLASEGYLWEMLQRGNLDVPRIEQDFTKLMDFWKSVYLKQEESNGSDQNL